MLDVKIDKSENCIEVSGNVVQISSDVGLLIKVIYDGLEDNDCKDFFVDSLKRFMNEGLYGMNSEELAELNKKKLKEIKKEKEKQKQEDEKKEVLESAKKLIEKMKEFGIL